MTTNELHSVLRRDVLKTIGMGAAVGAFGFTTMSGRVSASSHSAMYGTGGNKGEKIYEIDVAGGTAMEIASATDLSPVTNLNGNAFDAVEGRFYFTKFDDGPASSLYFIDVDSPSTRTTAGTLDYDAASGTIFDGAYYYVDNTAAALRKVTLASDGTKSSEEPVADLSVVGTELRFGDIVFENRNTLYLSSIDAAAGGTKRAGVVDLSGPSPTFDEWDYSSWSGIGTLQLALSADGTLYGQSAGDGQFYTIDKTDGTLTSAFNTGVKFTDLGGDWTACQTSYPLCAGQDIDVGSVTVVHQGDTLDITYDIDGPWLLYETHAHVASSLDGFPTTKQGNPKIGQFDYTATHQGVSSYTIEDVSGSIGDLIATHAVVYRADCGVEDGPSFWASGVEASSLGTQLSGDPLPDARDDPESALGAPDGDFVSLGFDDGYVVLTFDHPVLNGPSDYDIFLAEVTNGRGSYPVELADVYVRPVGASDFVLAGTVSNNDDFDGSSPGVGAVSIPDGIVAVDAVKIVNATPQANFGGVSNADGYDLNAVGANCLTDQNETAWTCPGTGGVESFVDRGSWATYFTYEGCDESGN